MVGDSLRRGLAAGLLAGILAGLFALFVGEVPVREAIRLEQQASRQAAVDDVAGSTEAAGPEVPRAVQEGLLPVGTAIIGATLGGLFGLAWAVGRRRIANPDDWTTSWRLAATAWLAVAFVPFLAAPPNPPGVEVPEAVAARSATYFVIIAVGLAGAVLCWWLGHYLRSRGVARPPRQTLTGLVAVGVGALILVTAGSDIESVEVPPTLLWQFRLASLGTQTILWAGIAVGNGWLWTRARARPERQPLDAQAPA